MFVTRLASITLAVVLGAASSGIAHEGEPHVTVRIAKTDRFLSLFGTSPDRSADVVVRLFRIRSSGDVLVDRRRVPVESNGTYRARFARPESGDCRVKVKIAGEDVRDEEVFPCYIPDFPLGTATMSSLPTPSRVIDALIADDPSSRGYGLMYRPKMRADLGMAFVYDSQAEHGAFWMKNTLIPLSIAFIDSNGIVVRILDMEPCVEDPCHFYDPEAAYQYALEVNQGAFEEWGISEGDRIELDY